MKLNRVRDMCGVENLASARVLEKVGMRFEGILRAYVHFKNAYCSVRMYAVPRAERSQAKGKAGKASEEIDQ